MPKNQPIRCFDGNAKPHEPFWSWRNAVEGDEPEMELYGYISEYSWWEDDITPKLFKDELMRKGNGGPVTVRIHSGGGDVTAASVIRAMMMDYPGRITVKVDGLCASAAMIVAMAGDRVMMQESAYMMIHDPWTIAMGNSDDLKKVMESLIACKDGILDTYESKTKMNRAKLSKLMTAETWMTARQSVEMGFADEVITIQNSQKTMNAIGNAGAMLNAITPELAKRYVNIPAQLLQPAEEPVIDPENAENQGDVATGDSQTVLPDANPGNSPENSQDNPDKVQELKHAANQLRAEIQIYL